MSSQINNNKILQNLMDLEKFSEKVSNEMNLKNTILKGGIDDCQKCKMYLDKNKSRTK